MNAPEQTTLAGDEPGEGKAPAKCDWCEKDSKHSRQLMKRIRGQGAGKVAGSGMFWYACDDHLQTLERHTKDPLPSRSKQ